MSKSSYAIVPLTTPPLTHMMPPGSDAAANEGVLSASVIVAPSNAPALPAEMTTAVVTDTFVAPSGGVTERSPLVDGGGGVSGLIVMLRPLVAVPPPDTWTVKLDGPAEVGVPLIAPPELKLRPDGRLPDVTDQLYGVVPPEAESDWL